MLDERHCLILAGGSGTRLWPLSRSLVPKHLLALDNGVSLLQQTAQRLARIVDPERILTVTHADHRFEVSQQLEAVTPGLGARLLAEPRANNTLPATAWGVTQISKRSPQAVIGVFPSDHLIQREDSFRADLEKAFEIANQGYLVTLGVKPTGPETGYGYIEAGNSLDHSAGFAVRTFSEKPNRQRAAEYLKKGNFYWNSGIFVFRASDFLGELERLEPAILKSISRIVDSGNDSKVSEETYAALKNISIDHGVMEKAKKVAVVPATFDWSDLGSWEAIYQTRGKDPDGNAVEGSVFSVDTRSSLLISKKGLLATIGLEDVVVVKTDDAVLVSRRDRVQEVKRIVDDLKKKGSPLIENHSTVIRPWGTYTVLEEGPGYKIKRIVVIPRQKLSLQRHQHRAEHWVVIEGIAKITNGRTEKILRANESTFIPFGEKHRLENPGDVPLVIVEVQTGSYLGEDDIERFDDLYGRP